MNSSRNAGTRLRSVEDLAEAKELRAAVAAVLRGAPIDDRALQCAVWNFVGHERRAAVLPAVVISRLTILIDSANIVPAPVRLALTRRVILWCVEEYFGRLGCDVLAMNSA
jgi:hypothetical protein